MVMKEYKLSLTITFMHQIQNQTVSISNNVVRLTTWLISEVQVCLLALDEIADNTHSEYIFSRMICPFPAITLRCSTLLMRFWNKIFCSSYFMRVTPTVTVQG